MQHPIPHSDEEAARIAAYAEMREKPRFALLLRTGKLITSHGELLCIIRDISETGVKLRLFHELPVGAELALESAAGELFPLECVWQSNGEAGLRFHQPIDVMRFIAEAGPYPRRAVRLRVTHEAIAVGREGEIPVTLRNLSREGARIDTEHHLAIGERIRLVSPALPELDAAVCWRRHPAYGLVFRQVLTMEDLALLVRTMDPPEPGYDLPPMPSPLSRLRPQPE